MIFMQICEDTLLQNLSQLIFLSMSTNIKLIFVSLNESIKFRSVRRNYWQKLFA